MHLVMNMDYYDIVCDYHTFDESYIDGFFQRCQQHGVDTVFWRVSVCGKVAYPSATRTVFDGGPHPRGARLVEVLQQFDPLAVACRLKQKYGIKVYPWVTLLDDYYRVEGEVFGLESQLVREHPEYCWVSRDGQTYFLGVLCYEYPAVIEERLAEVRELLAYDIDGLYLCTRGHAKHCTPIREPNYFGFNEPWVAQYRKRYGTDILTEPYDLALLNELRGESLTNFLRRVRPLVTERGIPLAVSIQSDPYAAMNISPMAQMRMQWEAWMEQHIIDQLVIFAGQDVGDMTEEAFQLYWQRFRDKGIESQVDLYAWLRIWDWSQKYTHADGDQVPTKPRSVITELLRRCARTGVYGAVLHEALNFEVHDGWGALNSNVLS